MPIRPKGSGFEVRVQYAGRRISKSFGNRRDAREFERRHSQRVEDSRVGRTPTYSLEEAVSRWLKGEASRLKSYKTIVDHIRPIYPLLKGRSLSEVVDVAQVIRDKLGDTAAPATINRKLAVLRRVSNLAYKQWGWLDAPLGDRIRMVPGERQRHTYLSRAQVAAIASKAPRRARDAILLAAMSGLRRGELLSLTPASLKDGNLVLPDSKNGRPRVVPLPPEALGIKLPLQVTASELRHGFDAARVAAGLPEVRFHDLRHTYASWLVQAGQQILAVRDLLGHASVTTTNRYAHLGVKHLRAAVKAAGIGRGLTKRKKKA